MTFLTAWRAAAVALATGTAISATPNVAVAVRRKRFIGVSFLSEGEAFCMDETCGDMCSAYVAAQGVGHRGRAADVDLALGDVRYELLEVRGREEVPTLVGGVVAHDEVELDATRGGNLLELLSKDDLVVADHAVQHD